MPKPVCRPCMLFFHPKRNGVYLEEGRPLGDGTWTGGSMTAETGSANTTRAIVVEGPGCPMVRPGETIPYLEIDAL